MGELKLNVADGEEYLKELESNQEGLVRVPSTIALEEVNKMKDFKRNQKEINALPRQRIRRFIDIDKVPGLRRPRKQEKRTYNTSIFLLKDPALYHHIFHM